VKYIVLVGDGMSDRPLDELNGRTPLEVSHCRNMDEIVKNGRIGTAATVPKGMAPASDVANLSILGYDPVKYYSGRGPLEAENIGVDLRENDVAFRCNLITEAGDKMVDYSAGHITSSEAGALMETIDKALCVENAKFYSGISYRNLMVLKAKSGEEAHRFSKIKCAPPHDIVNKSISRNFPHGEGREILVDLMKRSKEILAQTDINKVRIDLGENPASMIWLWGQGLRPNMPLFKDLYGASGSIISAVDLLKGMGKIVGLKVIDVPGATGYYDTNYAGKGEHALRALEERDFVFVHVEAPDEAGHNGDIREKITAIENFDKFVVGAIWKEYKKRNDFRIMVLPDHATPINCRTHTADPVPFAICGKDIEPDNACVFSEAASRATRLTFREGWLLMKYLIYART